ncbi:hypothetical protein [Desulfomonile tiedjei]|uniref:Uncharacterized protein n=1 Tax=Desulfomonile tiedjei (strain ATCC 49306 / DSM 6799 / DCB-1) TaxID=706587 RepID=I4CDP7_DESTA|nr:hypothetical protein [Desulfomonile tiedjei]AFM27688.1 hypothetical protein Desti_5078 [Desulfomonile tiedjei DSM 6799]
MAQVFPGLANPFSPVFSFPPLQGEAKASLIWVQLLKGKETIPAAFQTFQFRDDWGMERSATFLDAMVRLQVGPFSARLNYGMRYFKGGEGSAAAPPLPGGTVGQAAFDYTGLRIGGDFDVFRWSCSRIGIDMDYDLYRPTLNVSGIITGPSVWRTTEVSGPSALTLGFHVVLCPTYNAYGFSPIAEGRARWSIAGTNVTDWEIAGGVKTVETVLGVVALRSGYRSTTIQFKDWTTVLTVTNGQITVGTPWRAEVDVAMGGWFGELVYYY